MSLLNEMIEKAINDGFYYENAEAKICQDIILNALTDDIYLSPNTIQTELARY